MADSSAESPEHTTSKHRFYQNDNKETSPLEYENTRQNRKFIPLNLNEDQVIKSLDQKQNDEEKAIGAHQSEKLSQITPSRKAEEDKKKSDAHIAVEISTKKKQFITNQWLNNYDIAKFLNGDSQMIELDVD